MLFNDDEVKELEQIARGRADDIYKDFPLETRVKGVVNGKERIGTVKPKPEDQLLCFAPWHVPVLWDCNQTRISPVHKKELRIIT